MKLSLKNLKFHEDMSEETPCFSADLYDNGKLVAYVSNRGHGGCNDVRPLEGQKYSAVAKYDNMDIECKIMELAEELNIVKKSQTKAFILKKGEDIFTQKNKYSFAQMKKMKGYAQWLEKSLTRLKADGYTVLNTNI